MSASHNLSLKQHLDAGQLPMFMTGSEIAKHTLLNDAGVYYSHNSPEKTEKQKKAEKNMMTTKLRRSKKSHEYPPEEPLHDSIKREGVKDPVRMKVSHDPEDALRLMNGHHRVAAQRNIDKNRLIPITYTNY